jgi:hypothetical protein
LNTILNVRRDLRDSKKIARFWKRAAKEDSEAHVDTVTPSISMISSIHEVLSEERQSRVATLMARRKSRVRTYMTSLGYDSGLDNNSSDQGYHSHADCQASIVIPTIRTPTPAVHAEHSSEHHDLSTIPSYLPNLPPLASESFRQELVTSVSYRSVSKQITTSRSKPDIRVLNRPRASNATSSQDLEWSAKAFGKRKEIPDGSSNEKDQVRM